MEEQKKISIHVHLKDPDDAGKKLLQICQLGDFKTATKVASQILEVYPHHSIAKSILMLAELKPGRTGETTQVLQNNPLLNETLTLLELQNELAKHWIKERRMPSEDKQFAQKLDLMLSDLYFNYAQLFKMIGNENNSVLFLKKSINMHEKREAYSHLIATLNHLRRFEEAIEWNKNAIEVFPKIKEFQASLAYSLREVCDWKNYEKVAEKIITLSEEAMSKGDTPYVNAFFSATGVPDPKFNFQLATQQAKIIQSNAEKQGSIYQHAPNTRKANKRLKIAYISGGLRDHPTGRMMSHMLNFHDHNKYEIIAYSLSSDTSTHYTKAIQASCDFKQVHSLSSVKLAKQIYDDNIDILVDLDGYLAGGRMEALAYHPAPVQIEYLGYPGTTGGYFMDYIIADSIIIPEEHRDFFAEKVIYMPQCYQVNDSEQQASSKIFTRADFNIPENALVFACFNVSYKIDRKTFECWMKILEKTPNSVLWLLDWGQLISKNLREHAKNYGINPDRLIISEAMEKPEHLKRHELVDIFLDSFICNAHSTASDALWANVPVITLEGTHFASRVCSSLLNYVGTPELIATSPEQYIDLAINLANNPKQLAKIKKHLKKQVPETLFNTQRFVQHLEKAYEKVWDRFLRGKKPDHLKIETE